MRAPTTLIGGVEAAYRVDAAEDAWLEELVRAIAPALDSGVGVQGFRATFRPDGHTLARPVLEGGTEAWRERWLENWWHPVIEAVESGALRSMLSFGSISSAQQVWDAAARGIPTLDAHLASLSKQGWAAAFHREGTAGKLFYVDSLNVCAVSSTGEGVAIVANREQVLGPTQLRAARRRFARRAAHVTTALRLRERHGPALPISRSGEAVLTTNGKLLHAEGAARETDARASLRQAAVDLHRARTTNLDEAEALDLWRCLVGGRWTLIEEFESDGKRYLIAVPNEPRASSALLTERESQVLAEVAKGLSNKEIAYTLGVAPSSVATLVSRAAKKLGVESRVALVLRARELCAAAARGASEQAVSGAAERGRQ